MTEGEFIKRCDFYLHKYAFESPATAIRLAFLDACADLYRLTPQGEGATEGALHRS